MSFAAAWYLPDGTPAPGPDLGEVQPGQTKTIERRLRNVGSDGLSSVIWQLETTPLAGLTVTVAGHDLVPGVPYSTAALAPTEEATVIYTRAVPADAPPGPFTAFLSVRALS